jgi:hypothetical protein|tara:strand:+ start:1170 stop:1415 length:246 start_codon:yes stop_codon:yes gene_type:complete
MSAPDPMDRDVKVMFTDHSTRDYIITASNLKEAEEVFDTIFNHMEQSITDLLKQYSVGKKTKVWVEYHIDKVQDMNEEEND